MEIPEEIELTIRKALIDSYWKDGEISIEEYTAAMDFINALH